MYIFIFLAWQICFDLVTSSPPAVSCVCPTVAMTAVSVVTGSSLQFTSPFLSLSPSVSLSYSSCFSLICINLHSSPSTHFILSVPTFSYTYFYLCCHLIFYVYISAILCNLKCLVPRYFSVFLFFFFDVDCRRSG